MKINILLAYIAILYLFYSNATQSHFTKLCIVLLLSFICVYVEYTAFLKKQNIDDYPTVLYLLLDYLHVFIFLSILFLLAITVRLKCNLTYLFILNIFALFTILLFFYFKSCVLSLLMYKIINVKYWINPMDRLTYFFGLDKKYNIEYRKNNIIDVNTWINGQYLFFISLLGINIYYFIKKQRC
jgi:hypothetical protein